MNFTNDQIKYRFTEFKSLHVILFSDLFFFSKIKEVV